MSSSDEYYIVTGEYGYMNTNRRHAVAALIAAGLLWGTTVPLSKLALEWLSPGWLTAARFGLAAAVLLAAILLTAGRTSGRAKLRAAFTPKVLASGVLGYGGSVMVQNAGISRTSVTHAALLIGATPVLVAIIAAVWHRTVARPVAWVGFVVSLLGVGLVTAGGGGGGATMAGDGLVLASLFLGAAATVAQGRLLTGRDPVAVTAVQFLGAARGRAAGHGVYGGCAGGAGQPGSRAGGPRADGGRHACCRSPCSRSGRAGCPPRSPGRSSTSSRWSAPSWARRRSGTRSASRRSPAARPSWRASG